MLNLFAIALSAAIFVLPATLNSPLDEAPPPARVDYRNDGNSIDLTAETTTPGGEGSSNGGGGGGTTTGSDVPPPCRYGTIVIDGITQCSTGGVHHGAAGTAPDSPTAPVTISDIASFIPGPRVQQMEPNGWVIVNLPANIYSLTTSSEIVPGQLLGRSADVRFTPVTWHWDYGDGTTASLPTAGTTWAKQGLAEFDTTPTSHVYRSKGAFTIQLDVTYTAEYRIDGGPFIPIAGTLTLPANDLHITSTGAKTVLVERNCIQDPHGPGC